MTKRPVLTGTVLLFCVFAKIKAIRVRNNFRIKTLKHRRPQQQPQIAVDPIINTSINETSRAGYAADSVVHYNRVSNKTPFPLNNLAAQVEEPAVCHRPSGKRERGQNYRPHFIAKLQSVTEINNALAGRKVGGESGKAALPAGGQEVPVRRHGGVPVNADYCR